MTCQRKSFVALTTGKEIIELLAAKANLRSKQALIQAFIDNNRPGIQPDKDVATFFEQFWTEQIIF